MIFSHDTEHALETVVDLVNSGSARGERERLATVDQLEGFVSAHRISGVERLSEADIAAVHEVRSRFAELFATDDARASAALVNSMLSGTPVRPRLTDHDGYGWHVHYFAPGATLAEHLGVDGGMALAHVVTADELDRLRECDAPACTAALVDLSRNRSKRYCDAGSCGNRLHVAAYRERKRSGLAATRA
ncbi:MAG: CGNR zinc finger domain-containing protein [Nocardioidaceae bacterium]